MKKVLVLSMVFMALAAVGCGKKKEVNYDALMEVQANSYYEKYLKGKVSGVDIHVVSIELMKNANENAGGTFALDDLKDCKDSSYVDIYADKTTGNITKYEYHMNCE